MGDAQADGEKTVNRAALLFCFSLIPVPLALCPLHAQEAPLQQANALYLEGKFSQVIEAYQNLLNADADNPTLHYNLGNAYFKSNQLGKAVAEYQRAYDLYPRDSDILFNLEFALNRSGENLTSADIPRALYRAFTFFSLKELEGLTWAFYWALLLSLCLWTLRRSEKIKSWTFAFLALSLFWGSWWGLRKTAAGGPLAVTLSSNSEVRNGPGENFSAAFTLPEGRRLQILSERGDWLEVGVLKEGVKGWIHKESVLRI